MIFRQNDELNLAIESKFQARNEKQFALQKTIVSHLAIPNLIGFWPMSSADTANNGDCFDTSGAGRTLSNINTVEFGYDGIIPISSFSTTPSQTRLMRVDEAGTSITGTETYVVSGQRGITLGGWFRFDNDLPASFETLLGKWLASGNQRSFLLFKTTTGSIRFNISSDGSSGGITLVEATSSVGAGQWCKIDVRYKPSTELKIFIDGVSTINTTSIPASVFDSSAELSIGGISTGNSLNGISSMCYLSASTLDDALIQNLYHSGKPLYQG